MGAQSTRHVELWRYTEFQQQTLKESRGKSNHRDMLAWVNVIFQDNIKKSVFAGEELVGGEV